MLEITKRAVGRGEVLERRASGLDGLGNDIAHVPGQTLGTGTGNAGG